MCKEAPPTPTDRRLKTKGKYGANSVSPPRDWGGLGGFDGGLEPMPKKRCPRLGGREARGTRVARPTEDTAGSPPNKKSRRAARHLEPEKAALAVNTGGHRQVTPAFSAKHCRATRGTPVKQEYPPSGGYADVLALRGGRAITA